MSETWTVGRLIAWAKEYLTDYEVESPRLSGELLLARVLDCRRVDLYLRFDQPLKPEELAAFKQLILRRREHEPTAYLVGGREFYGRFFAVGPGVLTPRPETEHLVEEGLRLLAEAERPRILDLCTGSGVVLISLLLELPDASGVGVDISEEALAYARTNGRTLGADSRAEWLSGSLWEPLAPAGGFFDLITANPPYARGDQWESLPRQVRDFEPRLALTAGDDGLEFIRDIIAGAGAFLRPGGGLLVELGAGQDQDALAQARAAGVFDKMETVNDLAGAARVLVCRRRDYG